MGRKKVGRNQPCPCGSGRKYKHCCIEKEFDFVEDDDGTVFQNIPISDEMMEILDEQKRKFRDVYGRDPGPNDKVFFDAPPYELIEHGIVQAMQEVGFDPSKVNAFIETGLIPSELNINRIPKADLDKWSEIVQRYEIDHGKSLPPIPWTRTEWKGMKTSDLKDFPPFFDYIHQLRKELFSNRNLCEHYFNVIELLLLVTDETDIETIDEAWISKHREDLILNKELLRRILEIYIQLSPDCGIGHRGAFELGTFLEDFVKSAQQQIGIDDDPEIDELCDFVNTIAFMQLVLGVNKHFGLIG